MKDFSQFENLGRYKTSSDILDIETYYTARKFLKNFSLLTCSFDYTITSRGIIT